MTSLEIQLTQSITTLVIDWMRAGGDDRDSKNRVTRPESNLPYVSPPSQSFASLVV
jgi:hypothetical protein